MTHLIATHDGTFHADDVFGVAVLAAVFPDHELIRTRDADRLAGADSVVDVGGTWDAASGRFDHHQRGFTGARTRLDDHGQAVPAEAYAGAGLVWAEHGRACVRQMARSLGHAVDDALAARIAADIDATLVRYIDLVDNGVADVAPGLFGLSSQLSLLNTSWLEERALAADALAALQLERFREAMALVTRALERFVLRAIGQSLAADDVRRAERPLQGRVLLLREGGMPWTRVVVDEMPEVLLVVYPESSRAQYQLRTVPAATGSFASRMDLPAAWAGLRDEQLAAVTGVPDAVFCHMNLFIAGARSLEGALRLAALALER
ncbi:MAG: MYG1 family protein [Ramlibacter sp.]